MLLNSHDLIEGAHVRVGLANDIHRHNNQSNVPKIPRNSLGTLSLTLHSKKTA